jgi:hypothetical protein
MRNSLATERGRRKINRPLNMFAIDILLLSIDICQRVTYIYMTVKRLKNGEIKKNKNISPEWSKRTFFEIYQ